MNWGIVLWIVGISLFIFGFFLMIISYRREWVTRLRWDPSLVGLGLALVSIGFFFLDEVVGK